jgi:hypothetical protein
MRALSIVGERTQGRNEGQSVQALGRPTGAVDVRDVVIVV